MFDACFDEHPRDDDAFDQCICKPGGVHDSEAKAYADLMTQCPNFDYSEDLEDLEQDGCERAASLAAVQESGGRARRTVRRQQRKSKARGLILSSLTVPRRTRAAIRVWCRVSSVVELGTFPPPHHRIV